MCGTYFTLRNVIIAPIRRPSRTSYFLRTCTRQLSENSTNNSPNERPSFNKNADSGIESQEILDVYKERLKYSPILGEEEEEEESDGAGYFGDINLNRGVFGVFDIEDLVETLRHQQAEDIFVASVPKEIKYVDYIVIASGRSQRHMQAIAQFVRRIYKHKRNSSDIIPKLEGGDSPDWMALDMGNIALHIFSQKARLKYDLDSLWAVGPKYDDEYNKEEPVSQMLSSHSSLLKGLEPA